MKYLSRVVWSEGMYLGPHHFQAQNRYFEDSANFTISALWFQPFGLVGCALDPEALRNGTLSMLHARGILPDGLAFHIPDCDAVPPARNIADLFPPVRDKVVVLLALPERKQNSASCLPSDSTDASWTRFTAASRTIRDETTGRDEEPVLFGRKNLRLVLDLEMSEGAVGLPVARVMRDGSGHFVFDPEFIPPCTRISASERLLRMLDRLIGILDEKSAALTHEGRVWTDYASREIAQFWLLHTVNAALGPLRHMYHVRSVHPEILFSEMLRLAGALCTFAVDSHPRTLPLYDPLALDECFGALDQHIRTHLDTIMPSGAIRIPLRRTADCFYEGDVTDQRCLDRARWIFGIHAHAGEVDLIGKTPALVKICSKMFVPKLVERAVPGLPLVHLPVTPSAIAARVDAQYFSISRGGPCWDHIVQTRQIGVYVPADLPDPELELLVILES